MIGSSALGRALPPMLVAVLIVAAGIPAFAQGFFDFRKPAAPAQPQARSAAPALPGLFPAAPPPRAAAAPRTSAPTARVAPAPGSRPAAVQPPARRPARAVATAPPPPAAPAPAAQAPTGFRFPFFDFFRRREPPPPPPEMQPQIAAVPPVQAPPRPAKPAKPAVEIEAWVVVLGDSIADHLASGLGDALDDRPEISVRRRIRAASGLVNAEDYDWAKLASELAGSDKLTYAVIELGSKDNQPFHDGDREIPLLSDEWKQLYRARVDAMLAPFKGAKAKVFWVGAPPMRDEALSADLVAINDLIKERVALAGGSYLDVWEGFVDESDAYSQTGPDLEGREVKLRLNDGMHFTRAGARKLAHYVEREIRRHLDEVAAPVAGLPDIPGLGSAQPIPDAGPVILLTAPALAPNGQLVGDTPPPPPEEIERVLVRGEAPEAVPGRLDDARWQPAGAIPAATLAAAPLPSPVAVAGPSTPLGPAAGATESSAPTPVGSVAASSTPEPPPISR